MSAPEIQVAIDAEAIRLCAYEGPITREVAYDFYCAGISLDPKDPRAATLEAFEREFSRPFRATPMHLLALARFAAGDGPEPLDQFEREAVDELTFSGLINCEVGQPHALSRRGRLVLESFLASLDALVDEPRLRDRHQANLVHTSGGEQFLEVRTVRAEDCKRQPRPPIDPASN